MSAEMQEYMQYKKTTKDQPVKSFLEWRNSKKALNEAFLEGYYDALEAINESEENLDIYNDIDNELDFDNDYEDSFLEGKLEDKIRNALINKEIKSKQRVNNNCNINRKDMKKINKKVEKTIKNGKIGAGVTTAAIGSGVLAHIIAKKIHDKKEKQQKESCD